MVAPGPFPFGFDVAVRRYGAPDKFGHRPPPAEHTLEGCAAAPEGSTEETFGQQITITDDTIYAPFGSDVKPTDELVVPDGQVIDAGVYQVKGMPQPWRSPYTGHEFGVTIRLTRGS